MRSTSASSRRRGRPWRWRSSPPARSSRSRRSHCCRPVRRSGQNGRMREEIENYVRELGLDAYLVGGAVRDELLGLDSKDADFLVPGLDTEGLRAALAPHGRVEDLVVAERLVGVRLHPRDGRIRKLTPAGIEFAPPRKEVSTGPGRHDFEIVADASLSVEEDMGRRDFTVNAMARRLATGELVDPLGGRADLEARRLRTVSPQSFREDPLRLVRALRFVSQLGFEPDDELLDNHIYWGNEPAIDPRRVTWRRAVDMNDRALRSIVNSLGGVANGFPREDGFVIPVASEVMAIFCLATDLNDLKRRLANIIVAQNRAREPVRAGDLKAAGAMAVLLRDALAPNLVQTLENSPAFIHGGPFANIAHGCNSVIATTTALKLADYVVTEAGFGADLGAEKFFDIKCRKAGLRPNAAVIVATVRALKMHGGVPRDGLKEENVAALEKGFANLQRHLENLRGFGVPAVVSVNRFSADTEAELGRLKELCAKEGVEAVVADHWARGGEGAADLARAVVGLADSGTAEFKLLYPDEMPLRDKIKTIAQKIYRARDIACEAAVESRLAELQKGGFGQFPVCIAKTQYSFTTDPNAKGAPTDHVLSVREIRLSAGAEFIVAVCGEIMTMPGLPRVPAANNIDLAEDGRITGLF